MKQLILLCMFLMSIAIFFVGCEGQELKLIDNILSLGKIEYSTPDHQYYETLYKSEDKK